MKARNTILIAVVGASAICAASSAGANTVENGTFEPRGGEDRTAEVLAAVKSGATLRFAKGEYHFRSPAKLYYYSASKYGILLASPCCGLFACL